MQRQAIANNADDDALDDQRLFPEINHDRLELVVLGQQRHQRSILAIALDRNLVVKARDDDLPAAHLGGAMHGDEVAVENARILHAHAVNTQQVMRLRAEQLWIEFVMCLDVFLRENRVTGRDPAAERQTHLLAQRVLELDAAGSARHQLDLLIEFGERPRYWVNPDSAKGRFAELALLQSESAPPTSIDKEQISGEAMRYADWVLPGILGMNMMFSSLFGVGYVVVRYRKNGFLKRLRATPLRAIEFVMAQVASRLLLIMVITSFLFAGTSYFLDIRMEGSYVLLLLVMGTILDTASIILILVPLFLPAVEAFGLDLVWFGIITVVGAEIGLLTPPLGISCFVIKSTLTDQDVTLFDVFAGAFPFAVVMLLVLVVLIAYPELSLVLL